MKSTVKMFGLTKIQPPNKGDINTFTKFILKQELNF